MATVSPLACGCCLDPVVLSVDAHWVATVSCPTCGCSALVREAFREAEAYETAYLCRGGPKGGLARPIRDEDGQPVRFVTSRMLCVLRRA